ncbi:expressed unknown protein [Seminavis robusta]|uniref:Uncharacterized protein n=1 Tax=Seminavis robusta TaxID=568900 RepID=A0A9N8DEH0_9STRA|nr:expressed unknown protein [Seminavis robusta]|eukprot:Sro102_g051940.1 n/a (1694) ;mRNA; r:25359-30596
MELLPKLNRGNVEVVPAPKHQQRTLLEKLKQWILLPKPQQRKMLTEEDVEVVPAPNTPADDAAGKTEAVDIAPKTSTEDDVEVVPAPKTAAKDPAGKTEAVDIAPKTSMEEDVEVVPAAKTSTVVPAATTTTEEDTETKVDSVTETSAVGTRAKTSSLDPDAKKTAENTPNSHSANNDKELQEGPQDTPASSQNEPSVPGTIKSQDKDNAVEDQNTTAASCGNDEIETVGVEKAHVTVKLPSAAVDSSLGATSSSALAENVIEGGAVKDKSLTPLMSPAPAVDAKDERKLDNDGDKPASGISEKKTAPEGHTNDTDENNSDENNSSGDHNPGTQVEKSDIQKTTDKGEGTSVGESKAASGAQDATTAVPTSLGPTASGESTGADNETPNDGNQPPRVESMPKASGDSEQKVANASGSAALHAVNSGKEETGEKNEVLDVQPGVAASQRNDVGEGGAGDKDRATVDSAAGKETSGGNAPDDVVCESKEVPAVDTSDQDNDSFHTPLEHTEDEPVDFDAKEKETSQEKTDQQQSIGAEVAEKANPTAAAPKSHTDAHITATVVQKPAPIPKLSPEASAAPTNSSPPTEVLVSANSPVPPIGGNTAHPDVLAEKDEGSNSQPSLQHGDDKPPSSVPYGSDTPKPAEAEGPVTLKSESPNVPAEPKQPVATTASSHASLPAKKQLPEATTTKAPASDSNATEAELPASKGDSKSEVASTKVAEVETVEPSNSKDDTVLPKDADADKKTREVLEPAASTKVDATDDVLSSSIAPVANVADTENNEHSLVASPHHPSEASDRPAMSNATGEKKRSRDTEDSLTAQPEDSQPHKKARTPNADTGTDKRSQSAVSGDPTKVDAVDAAKGASDSLDPSKGSSKLPNAVLQGKTDLASKAHTAGDTSAGAMATTPGTALNESPGQTKIVSEDKAAVKEAASESQENSKAKADAQDPSVESIFWPPKPTEPEPRVEPKRCDVNRLKMAIFSASSLVHRGSGFEKLFSQYWRSLSLIVAARESDDLPKLRGVVNAFLKTRKLQRLHNKLIMALIRRSHQEIVPVSEVTGVVPSSCRDRVEILPVGKRKRPKEVVKPPSKTKETLAVPDKTGQTFPRRPAPYALPLFQDGTQQDVERVPLESDQSASMPGAMVVDPRVREIVHSEGMRVSENAVWLFVVAVKEYAKSMISKTVQSKEAIRKHRIPPKPESRTILCKPNPKTKAISKKDSHDKKSNAKRKVSLDQNRVISATDLSMVGGKMQMGPIGSLGGTVSRLACERTTFAPTNSNNVLKGGAFDEVRSFLTSELWSASLEKQNELRGRRLQAKSSASPKPPNNEGQNENASAKKEDFSAPKPAAKQQTTAAERRTSRSPVPGLGRGGKNLGLGRGAKNLAALMARTSAAAPRPANPPSGAPKPAASSEPAQSTTSSAAAAAVEPKQGATAPSAAAPSSTATSASSAAPVNPASAVVPVPAPAPAAAPPAAATPPPQDQPATTPEKKGNPNQVVRRGRGLGKKNLAFMRARVPAVKPNEASDDGGNAKTGNAPAPGGGPAPANVSPQASTAATSASQNASATVAQATAQTPSSVSTTRQSWAGPQGPQQFATGVSAASGNTMMNAMAPSRPGTIPAAKPPVQVVKPVNGQGGKNLNAMMPPPATGRLPQNPSNQMVAGTIPHAGNAMPSSANQPNQNQSTNPNKPTQVPPQSNL